MSNDTNRHINHDGSYTCSIIHNTFVCYHNISDKEDNLKITITEEGNREETKKED